MSSDRDSMELTSAPLRATNAADIRLQFAKIRRDFGSDLAVALEQGQWDHIRVKWEKRSGNSVPERIQRNWAQPASESFRQIVLRENENLIGFINIRLSLASRTLDELMINDPESVAGRFRNLRIAFDKESAEWVDESDLETGKLSWLGRRAGVLALITDKWLKSSPLNLKPVVGKELNKLRAHVEPAIEERRTSIVAQAATSRDHVDLSLPGVRRSIGSRHLITQTIDEIERIFLSLGYTVAEGPEIETPYYNFEALNIPEHHPVRDDMDTFYLDLPPGASPRLLRTHTSPVQIRAMEKRKPPVRIIVPGKVYRRDNPDATHAFMFHQIEGLAVDTDITFCDYKGTMEYFVRQFLGPSVKTRFRPSYFPFTEPSVEVDGSCHVCHGEGCRVCKFSGWIELLGSGMVDPAVYGFVGYDQTKLNGFAFGMGVDRLAFLKYGLNDLQVLFQNDVRFLRQFP